MPPDIAIADVLMRADSERSNKNQFEVKQVEDEIASLMA
jgi:hypothetical protein